MARLSLSLLGPFQAALDGEPITAFESNKVRALLTYLAAEADRPHSREKLAGLLWSERSDQDASANLRYALSNLRAAIGDRVATPPFLLVSRQTIQFNRASDAWVDVAAFAGLLTAPGPGISELERAVDLYQGEFLEGFFLGDSVAFEEWVLLKREQLGRQVRSTLHRLAAMYEQRGEYEHALPHAWRQVELDPWQEQAHRQLMRLLALSGQRATALTQYEAFRRALAEELGVEPARVTIALYERIRDGKGGLDERGDRPLASEAVPKAAAASLPPARRRLSRRTRLVLMGGSLAALVIAVVLALLATGSVPFMVGIPASPTPLPAPGAFTEGKLVFVCEDLSHDEDDALPSQICVADCQTDQRVQITDDLAFGEICCLAWSPDGQQIVLSARPPERPHSLYTINADGSGLQQLTSGEMTDIYPAWSPDGQWIVFTHGDALWLIRPDGSEAHALLTVRGFHLSRAAWSPDSQRIAFVYRPARRDALHGEVWVIDRDGDTPRQIYAFERASEDEGVFLGWSPDGRQVGYFLFRPSGSTALLVDALGSGETQAMEGAPESWLPDYWPLWGEERQ